MKKTRKYSLRQTPRAGKFALSPGAVATFGALVILMLALLLGQQWYANQNQALSHQPQRKSSSVRLQAIDSILGLSARLSYDDLRYAAEQATVEARTGSGEQRQCERILGARVCATALWNYRIERTGAVRFTANGDLVRMVVPLAFAGVVGIDGKAAKILGFRNKQLNASLELIADIQLVVDSNWCPRIQSKLTHQWISEPRLRLIGKMKINLRKQADKALRKRLPKMQKKLAKVIDCEKFSERLAKQWKIHHVPLKLPSAEQNYLKIHPFRLAFSGSQAHSDHLTLSFSVDATTETVAGIATQKTALVIPEPDGLPGQPGDVEFSLLLRTDYSDLRKLLMQRLHGKTHRGAAAELKIEDLQIYPSAERLVFKVDFTTSSPNRWFDSSGELFISGKPQISSDGKSLSFADLKVTRVLDQRLWRLVATIFNQQIIQQIERAAVIDLRRALGKIEKSIAKTLSNPDKTAGIQLTYTTPQVSLEAVNPEPESLAAIIHVSTNLQATIPRELLLPK